MIDHVPPLVQLAALDQSPLAGMMAHRCRQPLPSSSHKASPTTEPDHYALDVASFRLPAVTQAGSPAVHKPLSRPSHAAECHSRDGPLAATQRLKVAPPRNLPKLNFPLPPPEASRLTRRAERSSSPLCRTRAGSVRPPMLGRAPSHNCRRASPLAALPRRRLCRLG